MHSSGSLIKTSIETIRMLLNEATLDAKYDDAYIVRTSLSTALTAMVSRSSQGADNPVLIRLQVDLVNQQQYYQLPPHVLQVLRISKFDDMGRIVWDWKPRGEFHPIGPGWILDGNTLRLNPYPTTDETIHLWYIPSGTFNAHYGETGSVSSTTNVSTFTLGASPALGVLGRGESEYAGAILRVLDDGTGGTHYERVISSYNQSTRACTLRLPIPTLTKVNNLKYEVVPAGSGPFWEAAASFAAMRIAVGRKVTQQQMRDISMQHASDLKTMRDTLFQMQARVMKHNERHTIDNPEQTISFDRDIGTTRLGP